MEEHKAWQHLTRHSLPGLEEVTRVEVIEYGKNAGDSVTYRTTEAMIKAVLQDDGRTLKLFVKKRPEHAYVPTLAEIAYVRRAVLHSYEAGEYPDYSGQTPWIREILDQPDGGVVSLLDNLAFMLSHHYATLPHQPPPKIGPE